MRILRTAVDSSLAAISDEGPSFFGFGRLSIGTDPSSFGRLEIAEGEDSHSDEPKPKIEGLTPPFVSRLQSPRAGEDHGDAAGHGDWFGRGEGSNPIHQRRRGIGGLSRMSDH